MGRARRYISRHVTRQRLRKRYDSYAEFRAYSNMYGLHKRLGYRSAKAAWRADPLVASSVYPEDFRVVGQRARKRRNPRRRCRKRMSRRNPRSTRVASFVLLPHPEHLSRSNIRRVMKATWYEAGGVLMAPASQIGRLSEDDPLDAGVDVRRTKPRRVDNILKRYSREDGFYHA